MKQFKLNAEKLLQEKKHDFYGWDNEFGHLSADVEDFAVNKFLTTNKKYLAFVKRWSSKS